MTSDIAPERGADQWHGSCKFLTDFFVVRNEAFCNLNQRKFR